MVVNKFPLVPAPLHEADTTHFSMAQGRVLWGRQPNGSGEAQLGSHLMREIDLECLSVCIPHSTTSLAPQQIAPRS
jgi:hypothetical protein